MRVVSVNFNRGRSSVVSSINGRITEGRVLTDSAFPRSTVRQLKDVHNDWEYITCHDAALYSEFKTQARAVTTARPVLVDYKEALAMSAISMKSWTSCAVMIVDSYYCALGYYADKQFHWIREFNYPNSIALFYSAATRFLGFDPLTEEHKTVECSQYGLPTYEQLITDKLVHCGDGEYTLLQDFTRGFGTGPLNLDIASSVQAVFDKVIVSLATWLNNAVQNKHLAYAGRASANYLTNTKIANSTNFHEIAIQPLTSYAGAVVGANSLINRTLFDTVEIGPAYGNNISADTLAADLLRGNVIPYVNGRQEFADAPLLNNSWLCIPFGTVTPTYRKLANLTNEWQQPMVVCQEKDYSTYYEGKQTPYYAQFMSANKQQAVTTNSTQSRVITTSMSKNAYLNRVLEVLRAEGYPLLLSSPIK